MTINKWDEPVGLLKRGTIVGYDPILNNIKVNLNTASAIKGQNPITIDVPAPLSMSYNNGLYIGSYPIYGTPVVVGQGSGNQYYFVSHIVETGNASTLP